MHHREMVTPGRLKLRASEVDRHSRALLDQLARLRRLDARHAELAAEQRGLVADRNAEVRRRDAARTALAQSRQVGWVRADVQKIDAGSAADAIEIIRCAGIMIGTLNKILVQNGRHLTHLESIRRGLRLLVKKP
jgi:hypothetical protein